MFKLISLPITLIFAFLISNCASKELPPIQSVQVGDSKSKVLNTMGKPSHTSRYDEGDVWVYYRHWDNNEYRSKIFFQNTVVSKTIPWLKNPRLKDQFFNAKSKKEMQLKLKQHKEKTKPSPSDNTNFKEVE